MKNYSAYNFGGEGLLIGERGKQNDPQPRVRE